ncbi:MULTISPECIES: DUF6685 family protein [Halomonadaceae]|nr:DUF6685 family protein [Halomonas sp. HAL1]EHA16168.1 hypothetical protein HAL1_07360 [Halomonas sp. HAL1]WKV95109.1 hypothetical protein Q3Y66_20670 [Halomonas sp. HAL1]
MSLRDRAEGDRNGIGLGEYMMLATTLLGRWLRHVRWARPAAVQHAVEFSHLAARVTLPAASASELGIIQWHRWPLISGGDIAYWQPGRTGLQCQRLPYAAAAGLTTTTYDDDFSCSIRDITSLASGKGDLVGYATLDTYAMGECRGLVHYDRASIEPLLNWHELRFHSGAGTEESLESYSWQPGSYHLHNQGGAHHFAAARLIAGFFDPGLRIKAPLTKHALNPEVAYGILCAFVIFCEPEEHMMNEAFMKRMEVEKIPFAICAAPPPWQEGHHLLLLPCENSKAMTVADIFRAYGWLDVGDLLLKQAKQQQ